MAVGRPMRRMLAVIAVLAGVACHSAVPAVNVSSDESNAGMTWRVVTSGSQAPFRTSAGHAAISHSDNDYRALWSNLIGGNEPPAIDFSRETAVILISPQKPTDGYAFGIRDI